MKEQLELIRQNALAALDAAGTRVKGEELNSRWDRVIICTLERLLPFEGVLF